MGCRPRRTLWDWVAFFAIGIVVFFLAAAALVGLLLATEKLLRWFQPVSPQTGPSGDLVLVTTAERRLGRVGFFLLMVGIVLQSLVNFMQ